jgi:hypothetical protein
MDRISVLAILLLLLAATSCGDSADDPLDPPAPRSFLFGVRGLPDAEGQFVAVTSDSDVLARLEAELAVEESKRTLHIHGPVDRGDGGHNLAWNWHFVPHRWDVVELSIELCDGSPQGVEDDPDYWIHDVGAFCPWSSYVQREL